MILCPGCGAGMRFDPVSQMVKCDHCETKLEPENAVAMQMAGEQVVFDSTLYTCPQCGAELVSDSDTVATFCSYCGASVMLEGRAVKMAAPSFVLPFTVTKEMCLENYKKLIKRSFFAPSYMSSEEQLSKFRGIYIPYWNYKFSENGRVHYRGSKSYRRGDYIITDHYELSADVQADYQGLAFDASSSFADELSEAIAPFDVRANKTFSSAYLSGFYADTADVSALVYEAEAKDMVSLDIGMELNRLPEFRNYNMDVTSGDARNVLHTDGQEVSYFPVWFMSSRTKDGRVSYAVINGQTGRVAADIPIDYKKYLLGTAIIAVPIILLLNFLITMTPTALMIIAIAFAIVSWVTASGQMDQLYTRQFFLNDKGLQSARGIDSQKKIQESANASPKVKVSKGDSNVISGSLTAVIMIFILPIMISLLGFTETMFNLYVVLCVTVSFVIGGLTKGGKKISKNAISRKKFVYKKPWKEKFPVIVKPLIAIVLGVLVLLIHPVMDYYYYGGIIVTLILVVVSFIDVIRMHNELTKRMPRQFGKRGGDENGF